MLNQRNSKKSVRKSYTYPSGSSKAQITKAFYTSIWIQVLEELNLIYLLGEGLLTTISPVPSQNIKSKFMFSILNLVAMTVTIMTLNSIGPYWFHLFLKERVYFSPRETGMMDGVSDKRSEDSFLFSAPSIDLCGHRLVT